VSQPRSTPRPFNLPVLLLCLLAAALIWLMNALNKDNYTVRVQFPIEFAFDRQQFIPLTPLPNTVTVSLSGSGWILLRKSMLSFRARPVTYRIPDPLRATRIDLPVVEAALTEQTKDVRVNFVVGDTLSLAFDRRASREVPVDLDSTHLPLAPGFRIAGPIRRTPAKVRVEGPAHLMRAVPDRIRVRFPSEPITETVDADLPLDLPGHPLLKASADRVRVHVDVLPNL